MLKTLLFQLVTFWLTIGVVWTNGHEQQMLENDENDRQSLGVQHSSFSFGMSDDQSSKFGEQEYQHLVSQSHKENGFLDWAFGTNCHSRALKAIEKKCQELDSESKSRLALLLMHCQLQIEEQVRSPQCRNTERLKDCVSRLSARENLLYIEFLSHIDSMCLFLQNQEFEKQTEYLLHVLVSGSKDAAVKMFKMKAMLQQILDEQLTSLRNYTHSISKDLEGQRRITADMMESLAAQVYSMGAQHLSALQELRRMASKTTSEIQKSRNEVHEFFKKAHEEADTLLFKQADMHQAIDENIRLLRDSTHTFFDQILIYQRKTDMALSKILGHTYSVNDTIFYLSGLSCVVLTAVLGIGEGTHRLIGLAYLIITLFIERSLIHGCQIVKNNAILYEIIRRMVPMERFAMEDFSSVKATVRWALAIGITLFWIRQSVRKHMKKFSRVDQRFGHVDKDLCGIGRHHMVLVQHPKSAQLILLPPSRPAISEDTRILHNDISFSIEEEEVRTSPVRQSGHQAERCVVPEAGLVAPKPTACVPTKKTLECSNSYVPHVSKREKNLARRTRSNDIEAHTNLRSKKKKARQ